ncbi:PREDICTED: uncharacterized protein LOC109479413 isoform X2 [Branchiostoma belcheri]|uniref:Uncharacterized protein LOC109479413 isoform X2 n=1 Tax=Branchiostoma belcheri TaxID=7741 RepID=A0A6P5A156_BRABE|nr:PREDICTED: uncharacterized protein LOC109479413 isoform X2 [Branchiostoma belcheri]
MKRSGLLLCTFGLNRVLQFVVLMSVCWIYQDSRVEATTCDCAADCVSYCTAGVNLALGKPTAQSSTEHGGVAKRAVDGNTDGDYHRGSCTHTNNQGRPWWRVDLGRSQAIDTVVVFNRQDCCQGRLNNFRVHVGDSPTVTSNPQCGGNHGVTSGRQKITVDCTGRSGRYVGISLPTYEILTLCEVRVYGGGWLTRKSSWVVSSAGTPHVSNGVTYDAAKVLDGDSATYWNPQGTDRYSNNRYIILDLTAPHTLTRIALNNYGDTIHDIKVFRLQNSLSASPYTWEDVKPVDNVRGGTSDRQVFGGFQGTARYWRFVVTQTHSGWQPWLRELNLYGTSVECVSPPSLGSSGVVTANPNSSCPVAVGNPSPAALIAVSVVAGVAIVLAVAVSILYIGNRLELRKTHADQPLPGRDASYRSIPGQQYETIPDTVAGPLPIPAARVPPVVRHTDVELQARASGTDIGRQGEGEGGRKRRHQMAKGSRGGPRDTNAGGPTNRGPIGGMHHSPRPGGTRVPAGSPWTLEPDYDTTPGYVFENDGESETDVE